MSKILWVARDSDGRIDLFGVCPVKHDADGTVMWDHDSDRYSEVVGCDFAPDLQPGECRMFVEFAPRVADGGERDMLVWDNANAWISAGRVAAGLVVHHMLPDPTPYLPQSWPTRSG